MTDDDAGIRLARLRAERDRYASKRDQYAAAAAQIRLLHREVDGTPHSEGSCLEDGQDWPCATRRALDQVAD